MQRIRVPLWAVVVIGSAVAGSLLTSAVSQEAAAPRPCDVAVIDISKVFEDHRSFQGKMQQLKRDVESYELVLRTVQKEIAELKESLNGMEKGTRPYEDTEAEIERRSAQMQAEMKIRRQKFLQMESDFYIDAYHQVQKKVQEIARQRAIRLVIRFNDDEVNRSERQSVLQAVNRAVVFQDALDITSEVVKAVNES